jgi:hypothetical protein
MKIEEFQFCVLSLQINNASILIVFGKKINPFVLQISRL